MAMALKRVEGHEMATIVLEVGGKVASLRKGNPSKNSALYHDLAQLKIDIYIVRK